MENVLIASAYLEKENFKYLCGKEYNEYRPIAHERVSNLVTNIHGEVSQTIIPAEDYTCPERLAEKMLMADIIYITGSPWNMDQLPPQLQILFQGLESFLEEQRDQFVRGICFGYQMLNVIHGGKVTQLDNFYKGQRSMQLVGSNEIVPVTAYHEQGITEPSPGSKLLGVSAEGIPYATEFSPGIIGTQTHPEVPLQNKKDQAIADSYWKKLLGVSTNSTELVSQVIA